MSILLMSLDAPITIRRGGSCHYQERVLRRYYKHRQFFVDVPYSSA